MRKLLNIVNFNQSSLVSGELSKLKKIWEEIADMYRRYENHTHKGRSCPYAEEYNTLNRRKRNAANKVNQTIWKNFGKTI